MIYIVALGDGFKCPHKNPFENTVAPPPPSDFDRNINETFSFLLSYIFRPSDGPYKRPILLHTTDKKF